MFVEFTIEPSWASIPCKETLEIEDEELEGLEGADRNTAIETRVADRVAEVASWGWEEVSNAS